MTHPKDKFTIAVVENDFLWVLDDSVSVDLDLAMSLMASMTKAFPQMKYVVINARTGANYYD